MPDYSITLTEVQALVPTGNEFVITNYITLVMSSDACLEGAGVPDDIGKALKRLAVAHVAQLMSNGGRGAVTSESAPSGASRSFAAWATGKGLYATAFGQLLKAQDRTGCVTGFLEADAGPSLFIGSVGT